MLTSALRFWSGFSSKFEKTGTGTGPQIFKSSTRPDRTDADRSSAVVAVIRPVMTSCSLDQSVTGLDRFLR